MQMLIESNKVDKILFGSIHKHLTCARHFSLHNFETVKEHSHQVQHDLPTRAAAFVVSSLDL